MLDVVKLLSAPVPWHDHGAGAPLPDRYQDLLSDDAKKAKAFFVATGPLAASAWLDKASIPGLTDHAPDVPVKLRAIRASTMAEVQAAVDEAIASARPQRLVISGTVFWDRSLRVERADQLVLDLSGLRVDVAVHDQPVILISGAKKVAVCGLRVTQVHPTAIDIVASEDISVSAAVLSGAFQSAIRVSGGSKRVLIDRSLFVRNVGFAIKVVGEVDTVVILHSQFDGPTAMSFIHLVQATVALGYAALTPDEPGRDALTLARPTTIRILENRFGRTDAVAILAEGTRGVWVERNDFNGAAGGAVCTIGHAAGLMVADNRIAPMAETDAPLIAINDTAFFCIFRNIFEPISQESIRVSGQFGGGLITANSLLCPRVEPKFDADGRPVMHKTPNAGIILNPGAADDGAFLATTLMLNTVRGAFAVGFDILGAVPRLFMFDNHFFGMTHWSIKSDVVQPMLTSLNNWSREKSLNMPLAEVPMETARMVWADKEIEKH